jgi:hypothetical protein
MVEDGFPARFASAFLFDHAHALQLPFEAKVSFYEKYFAKLPVVDGSKLIPLLNISQNFSRKSSLPALYACACLTRLYLGDRGSALEHSQVRE